MLLNSVIVFVEEVKVFFGLSPLWTFFSTYTSDSRILI